jgi:IS30 family transposase
MDHYKRLSVKERRQLHAFLTMGISIVEIAEKLNRHKSTIYREKQRNSKQGKYSPVVANELSISRRAVKANKINKDKNLHEYVIAGLQKGWAPEQICGRMLIENREFKSCPESIYRYVYKEKSLKLWKLLPRKKPKRLNYRVRKQHSNKLRNICNRPSEAAIRDNAGHWEGDTIRFPRTQKTCVTTLVERKSRMTFLRKNETGKSATVIKHICEIIKHLPKKAYKTLTFDQGGEFTKFINIERETKCKVYFCDPHSPWQRPTNENTNGRIRRFLPKNFNIDQINQDYLNIVANILNNTPRKCLGYKTPEEVFTQHCKSYPRLKF